MRKWFNSVGYACQGIIWFFQKDRNGKIELAFAVMTVIVGFILHIPALEWCIVLLCIGGVLGAEMFNSSLEKLADQVTLERRPEIGKLKDMAAAAVLIISIIACIIGAIIFFPRMYMQWF